MALKNTVAAERRLDLASLFCLIGRHGPAVALAVIAAVSVLVAFLIYRSVRGKRRRAALGDGDGDGEASSGREDRGAAEMDPSPQDQLCSGASTDMSDGFSPDAMEEVESDLKIRRRRAAAEKKPPPRSPPNVETPENRRTPASEDTREATDALYSCKPAQGLPEEAGRCRPSETPVVAEALPEDAAASRGVHDLVEDVQNTDGCSVEPELVDEEVCRQEGKVLEAERREDVTTNEDVRMINLNQEGVGVEWSSDIQTPLISDNDRQQHHETTTKMTSEEPDNRLRDVPPPSICSNPVERLDEENPDSVEFCGYSGNISAEEEKKEGSQRLEEEEEEECEEVQEDAQQGEDLSTNQPSESETVISIVGDDGGDEDKGLAGEVVRVLDEEHRDKVTAECFDPQSPQSDDQNQEDGPTGELDGDADLLGEEILTSYVVVVSGEDRDVSSLPMQVDDNCQSDINGSPKGETSGTAEFLDSSLALQPQMEDKMAPLLDEDPDSTTQHPETPSYQSENLAEDHSDGTEECAEPFDQPCRIVHTADDRVSDILDLAKRVAASVIAEEISCPQPASADSTENDEMRVGSPEGTASLAETLIPGEISHSEMSPSIQEQECHHMEEDLSPVTTEDVPLPASQIYLLSFGQSEQSEGGISSPGWGKESGISSLAVSPDLEDSPNEFSVSRDDNESTVMDCDQQAGKPAVAQTSLFADDVTLYVANEDTHPHPSICSEGSPSEHADWTLIESLVSNEDMFGHEIEESYHRLMDQFAAQIAISVTSYSDDVKTETDLTAVVEVVEIKNRTVPAEMKEATKEEKEKEEEEEYKRTEISIMEATMDTNEWITEGSYQVFPWSNLSALDLAKANQLPVEGCSAAPDPACTDITPSADVKQTSSTCHADENPETNKRVVAVQPMPQNVSVTFRVHYFTQSPYQTVAITGDQPELGNWMEFIPLERAKDGHWTTVVSLPAESHVEWKFVLLDKGEVCRWEECGNRLLDTGYGDDLLVQKWWGLM